MSDFAPLETYCADFLSGLEPAARRTLAREIASKLRTSQSRRIAAQLNPDGSRYVPRKPTLRAKIKGMRRRAMFGKLRTTKHLKTAVSPDSAAVTFTASVQHMAKVHHYGLRDKVNGRRGGPEVTYPARQLLGISASDAALIEELVLNHLAR